MCLILYHVTPMIARLGLQHKWTMTMGVKWHVWLESLPMANPLLMLKGYESMRERRKREIRERNEKEKRDVIKRLSDKGRDKEFEKNWKSF